MPVTTSAMPIFQHESGHAQRIKPLGDLLSLVVDGQMPVTPARTNHNRSSVSLFFVGKKNRQRRFIRGLVSLCPRRPVGPKQLPLWFRRKYRGGKFNNADQ